MDTNVNIFQLLEKLKKTIIEPQKKFWDEMEDETGMNKVEESLNETLHKMRNGFITNTPQDIVNLLKNKPKEYRILYDKNIDMYMIGDAEDVTHYDMIQSAYNDAYYYNMEDFINSLGGTIDNYTEMGQSGYWDGEPEENFESYLWYIVFSPNEEWELGTDGYNKRYDYPFGHIFTRGCDLSEIRLWDALGTPLNSESLNEEVSSAQLGTAPTPAVGQVTVNGQPWTSGKSYKAKKKKKKIKESSALTLTHTLKRLVENSLTNKIDETLIEWLDKFGFKNLKSDGGFVYEKEINEKNHVIVYNKAENISEGIYSIRYFIFNEDMPSGTDFDKTWEIFNVDQLKYILKSIEQEMI